MDNTPTQSPPREYTQEEVQALFLKHIWAMVDYWANLKEQPNTREKLSGLAFSILALLDGCTALPGFIVTPNAHPTDKDFHISEGENWFPTGVDIAGSLHELMHKFDPKPKAPVTPPSELVVLEYAGNTSKRTVVYNTTLTALKARLTKTLYTVNNHVAIVVQDGPQATTWTRSRGETGWQVAVRTDPVVIRD